MSSHSTIGWTSPTHGHPTTTTHFTPTTSAYHLSKSVNPNTQTNLHRAAQAGRLPPDTTPELLAATRDINGHTALHTAASFGTFPPNTTLELLASTKDDQGISALQWAAFHGNLPPHTSTQFLQKHQLWEPLKSACFEYPDTVLDPITLHCRLPYQVLRENPSIALHLAHVLSRKKPQHTNILVQWLRAIKYNPHHPNPPKLPTLASNTINQPGASSAGHTPT